jgi:hypothetical protein
MEDATWLQQRSTSFGRPLREQPSIVQGLNISDEGSAQDMNAPEHSAQAFISEHFEDIDTLLEILMQPVAPRIGVLAAASSSLSALDDHFEPNPRPLGDPFPASQGNTAGCKVLRRSR